MTANVQISGKANNGIIFVVGGNDFDEFRVNLAAGIGSMERADSIIAEAVKLIVPPTIAGAPSPDQFQQAAQNVQNAFPGSQPTQQYQPPAQQQYHQPPQQDSWAPRQATPPPGQTPPTCDHGQARVWKTGTGKNGKTWKAWMCPLDRSQACEPSWVR